MQWTESVGLTLVSRDLASLQLRTPGGQVLTYSLLQTFPFTSESKRMGVIVRVRATLWPQASSPGCPPPHGPRGLQGTAPAAWDRLHSRRRFSLSQSFQK